MLSEGFRQDYRTDPQGRRVRRFYAVKKKTLGGEQLVFWADGLSTTREHMELSFQQKREGIVHDCVQLKNDVDSHNDAHPSNPPIQLILDFNDDVKELLSTQFRPTPTPTPSGPSSTVH